MDGTTHINIYSQGKTSLGRALSNFSHDPIDTLDGEFGSVEAYWYWMGTSNPSKEILRNLHGAEAKRVGRDLGSRDWQDGDIFKLKIWMALLTKLIQHDNILEEFKKNKLPFRHYYVFKGKVVEPTDGKWIIDMWTFLQEQLCT